MRVLFAHNYYRSSNPSGENLAFDAEVNLARTKGLVTEIFSRHSDRLVENRTAASLTAGTAYVWSFDAVHDFKRALMEFKPDVVHAHNVFPLISPAILWQAARAGVPVCVTLHNYRLVCPAAIPLRNGEPCTECIGSRTALASLKYGCYRNSRAATFPIWLSNTLHQTLGSWRKCVDVFVALSQFQADLLVRGGIPAERIVIKPNFYPDPPTPVDWLARGKYAVYLGRISEEKGVDTLVEAWRGDSSLPPLFIVGSGPEEQKLRSAAAGCDRIVFLGQLPFWEAQRVLANSSLAIIPSRSFEAFPLVIREAFALAVPVLAARIGALNDLVVEGQAGFFYRPNDAADLARQAAFMLSDDHLLQKLSAGALTSFRSKYTAEQNYATLIGIYQRAIAGSHSRARTRRM